MCSVIDSQTLKNPPRADMSQLHESEYDYGAYENVDYIFQCPITITITISSISAHDNTSLRRLLFVYNQFAFLPVITHTFEYYSPCLF